MGYRNENGLLTYSEVCLSSQCDKINSALVSLLGEPSIW